MIEKLKCMQSKLPDLTRKELESMTNDIRHIILQSESGTTLCNYIAKAKQVNIWTLGLRRTNALKLDIRLKEFFPREIYLILKEKVNQVKHTRFQPIDIEDLRLYLPRGVQNSATYFYCDKATIYHIIKKNGLNKNDYNAIRNHVYSKDDDNFILNNRPSMSFVDIGKRLSISTRQVANRHRHLTNPSPKTRMKYTPEIDRFIKENLFHGYKYISESLKCSESAIRGRRLALNLPPIEQIKK